MDEKNNKNQSRSRVRRNSNTFKYIGIAVVVLLAIIFYFFMQKSPFTSPDNPTNNTPAAKEEKLQSSDLSTTTIKAHGEGLTSTEVNGPENQRPAKPTDSSKNKGGPKVDSSAATDAMSTSGQLHPSLSPEAKRQYLIDEINLFYTHLDQQPYMQSFGLKESSKIHFSKLLQKLVDNPPVVIRETDDLFTLLQNTAHFFRILGKKNINILKGILSNEQNSFEHILDAFYKLTYQPEIVKKEYSLSIPPDALTDYAVFFLNTMGGRLYLFRRDSTSRMVVSYYAIITIDRANIEGNGGHGIDIRPAILSLIEEIENGGRRLQLREKYLDTLYDLQEKYN
jgi:hypothetical protein